MISVLFGWWQRSYVLVLRCIGIIIAVLLVLFNIRQSGRKAERIEQLLKQNKNIEKTNEVEIEVRRLSDASVLDELRRNWSRK